MLKDRLTPAERDELQNIMRNEPVHPGETISHYTADSLWKKGLIRRVGVRWQVNWEVIKQGGTAAC